MRSLWRMLALQWLGGDGSEALSGDSTVLDTLLFGEHARAVQAFDVRRQGRVSHRALMTPRAEPVSQETAIPGVEPR
jgi:hypothetical protein